MLRFGFGLLMQVAAAGAFFTSLLGPADATALPVLNSPYIAMLLIALAGLFTGWWLHGRGEARAWHAWMPRSAPRPPHGAAVVGERRPARDPRLREPSRRPACRPLRRRFDRAVRGRHRVARARRPPPAGVAARRMARARADAGAGAARAACVRCARSAAVGDGRVRVARRRRRRPCAAVAPVARHGRRRFRARLGARRRAIPLRRHHRAAAYADVLDRVRAAVARGFWRLRAYVPEGAWSWSAWAYGFGALLLLVSGPARGCAGPSRRFRARTRYGVRRRSRRCCGCGASPA